jgi:hypothetical protein
MLTTGWTSILGLAKLLALEQWQICGYAEED